MAQNKGKLQSAMNNKIRKWFKSPYPLLYGESSDYLQIIITSIFIGALIYVTRPFGLVSVPDKALILFVVKLSSSAMFVSIFITQILPKYCFNEDLWQIWKQAGLILFNFLAIAFVLQYLVLEDISFITLLSYLTVTTLIALGPLTMRLLITQNRILKVNLEQARLVNANLEAHAAIYIDKNQGKDSELALKASDGDSLQISEQQFVYAKAEKNYVEIFWNDENKIKNTVLRMAFSTLIQQVKNSRLSMIHCHRSYLVNQQCISKVIGNSRGYNLELNDGAYVVPVSRAKSKQVLLDVNV